MGRVRDEMGQTTTEVTLTSTAWTPTGWGWVSVYDVLMLCMCMIGSIIVYDRQGGLSGNR